MVCWTALVQEEEGRANAGAEKASIDEAFLDLSLMVNGRLLTRFPYLQTLPDGAPNGLDTALPVPPPVNWAGAGNVFPVNGEQSKQEKEEDDGDGRESPDNESGPRWEDWALCLGAGLMAELRAEVYDKLHYTCSAVSRAPSPPLDDL